MATSYEMPAVEVGQVVTWFPTGAKSNEGLPAIITKVHPRTVALSVFSLNTYNLLLRDGVRHVADPTARQTELMESGAWDHTAAHYRMLELVMRIEHLASLIEDKYTQP